MKIDRLKQLQKLLRVELASDNPSAKYVDDLRISIDREIKKNYIHGYEIIADFEIINGI